MLTKTNSASPLMDRLGKPNKANPAEVKFVRRSGPEWIRFLHEIGYYGHNETDDFLV